MRSQVLFFISVFLFVSPSIWGQDKFYNVGANAGIGVNQSYSDLGDAFFRFERPAYGFGTVNFGFYLNRSFDLNIGFSYGGYGYFTPADSALNLRGRMGQAQLVGRYKFANGYILKEDSRWKPFVYLGAGAINFTEVPNEEVQRINNQSAFTANAGAGLTYQLNNRYGLTYNLGYIWVDSDDVDFRIGKSNEQVLQHSITLGMNLGNPKDDDGDGVPNIIDKCANTPKDAKVDPAGCPIDTDMDGVADYMDACINEKGLEAFNGCPDTDGDGIVDAEDNCPNAAGVSSLKGCPDMDNDGITDRDDECPNLKGLASMNGCPDSDGDGIADKNDDCPNAKGLANFKGCPDTDGDGIKDGDDACPNVAGVVANKGCPEVKEEVKQLFSKALTGIQFETGKDIIKKSSFPILDQVVKVMFENPTYKLDIFGHTDNQGDAAKNLDLSQRRANAVEKYLLEKGVPQDRIVAVKGFGSTAPVADNGTPAGRAQNRRVEFKVEF